MARGKRKAAVALAEAPEPKAAAEIEETPAPNVEAPALVGFSSYSYPDLRVLIRRGDGSLGSDVFAEFRRGAFETDDPETIEVLRNTPHVHENSSIDPESVPIEILNDDEHRVAVNARAAMRLRGLVLPQ
jgi:hypothetical protein